jgi:nuclear protein localization family protein 4
MAMLLRVRTKDGTERLQAPAGCTLGALRTLLEQQLGVPSGQQVLSRSKGPTGQAKGDAFTAAEDAQGLSALGMSNGYMLFLDYAMERDNQAQYVEKDPFKTMVAEGELRQQGKAQWTLTNFLDYRSTKEFVLGAPPEPHSKFVQIDQRATQTLMNYMIMTGFACKRVGWLYGRWVTDPATGEEGVQVHAIYEPKQECTCDDIAVVDDPEGEAKLAKLAAMLQLVRVGVVIAHPARQYVFGVNEILYAAKLHAQAVEESPEEGKRFITMKARPVLDTEDGIEGVATVECYQVSDQCVELASKDAFAQSKTDPRVAKCAKDCCFVVEKKEQRKATVEHFVARVFDVGRTVGGTPFASFLGSGFTVENRPTEPQDASAMAGYLRTRRSKREPFLRTVADLHFLLLLANLLDMNTEMPVLCATILEERGSELEGFQLMINSYAGIE